MPATKKPNLLFVFADQMRGMDMRCAGNADMITPAMDRLAREGVLCWRSYATVPICGPNRACLLTGTYSTTNGVLFNDQPLRTDLPTFGTLAQANGYRAGYVGKWHLDGAPRDKFTPPGPRRLGFDDFWAVHNCIHIYKNASYYRDTPEMIVEERFQSEVHTDLALEFLERCHKEDEPFCLMVSWEPPHNPYEEVPPKYQRMYDASKLKLRPNVRPIPRECLDPLWSFPQTIADYYALITSLDDQLTRLLEFLDKTGQRDNTIVVFTSDHGDMMWSQGLLYKCVPYEESVNVPLLVRWPEGIAAGGVCDTLIGTVDLLPTLAGMLGWECPEGIEGSDLSGALRSAADLPPLPLGEGRGEGSHEVQGDPISQISGRESSARNKTHANLYVPSPQPSPKGRGGQMPEPDSAFLAFYSPYVFRNDQPTPEWRGLRTPRYTYSATTDRKPWLVFDNEVDPYQMKNLANEPSAAAVCRALGLELERWLAKLGDPFLPHEEMKKRYGVGDIYKY